ncbi:MAG: type IX secretion system membrane protein PorP/SprF [Lewinella sp.]|nr:type IX secretion system membrane protein PorP/SprF [Lewinella sp.]
MSPLLLLGQDPFFTHFYGNEALFNPALTGNSGALSIKLKAKHQWHSSSTAGYRTYLAALEESLPCSFFDYGVSVLQDMEGDSYLRTQQFGVGLASPLPIATGLSGNLLQLRLGINILWAQQYVDYSRLLFIDQLDPKYGQTNANGQSIPTAFVPPNDGRSEWYFKPSGGFALQYVINPKSVKATAINLGGAIHNVVSLQSWSVLGLESQVLPRYSAFLNVEFVLGYLQQQYVSFKPQLFWQDQQGLTYWETGGMISFSKLVSAGMYYHGSRPKDGLAPTNWGSAQLEVGFFPGPGSRIDLGFGYAFNFSGLRNQVANVYELSVRFSFAKSPMCSLAGAPAPYDTKGALPCPTLRRSTKSKIYENIWYNN